MEKIKEYLKKIVRKSPQVLAIDRDEDNLVLIYQTLEMFGYSCVVTQDRKMAMNLANLYQPNLILLEISATHPEDFQLLSEFKNNPKTAKLSIIALTTYTNPHEGDRLLEMGCQDYLCKPYLINDLGTLVTRHLPLDSTGLPPWEKSVNETTQKLV